MITGAQTQTPAIGLSGPNTIITRKTLEPPVTVDNLNKYTFNIIPDRDPVPAIDDPANNYQRIACVSKQLGALFCLFSIGAESYCNPSGHLLLIHVPLCSYSWPVPITLWIVTPLLVLSATSSILVGVSIALSFATV